MTDSLGDRIKEYENVSSHKLIRRTPVIIRLDGKSFHSFVKKIGAKKPFDENFIRVMQETTKYLCQNIQGCRLGYVQSDEISLLLVDYSNIETDAFFDYKIQKICSVTASMATVFFNEEMFQRFPFEFSSGNTFPFAMFDSRCFNVPREDVNNCFLWRQQDCTRNSVQMLARSLFSHKECQGLHNSELQDKMMLEKNVNWNDLETYKKRGTCVYKRLNTTTDKPEWFIDKDIPIFSQDDMFVSKWTQRGNVEDLLKGWFMGEHGVFG